MNHFIQVHAGKFIKDQHDYHFIGTNFWSAVNLAVEQPKRLVRELDQLQALGINNLRIMALTEGANTAPLQIVPAIQQRPTVLNEDYLVGLDFLLVELAKRKMHAVLCLGNFWPWSGGMAQYVAWQSSSEIPYPPPMKGGDWWKYQLYAAQFYGNKQAVSWYHQAIEQVITRVNTISKQPYIADSTIMAWQLANEPRASQQRKNYLNWIQQTSQFIKKLAPNHLVSLGSEGDTTHPEINGVDVFEDHHFAAIDYITIHCWIQNWGWFNPEKPATYEQAKKQFSAYLKSQLTKVAVLKKPLVLEEFGIARDLGSHEPTASTQMRDRFFSDVFGEVLELIQANQLVGGANFWAWGGEGRPRIAKCLWQAGDDFTGDPPHEHQGWYSVYNTDESTLAVIKHFCQAIQQFNQPLEC